MGGKQQQKDNNNKKKATAITKDNVGHKAKPIIVDSERLALKLKREGMLDERYVNRRDVVKILRTEMESLYSNYFRRSSPGAGGGVSSTNTTVTPPIRCLTPYEEEKLWNITVE